MLNELVDDAKRQANGYDCMVPVSGGKDCWYQVITCQRQGLRPLAVTWKTAARTEIGQRNLDNMVRNLGVGHIDYSTDPDVERRCIIEVFERASDLGLPMHMAIPVIPTHLALQLGRAAPSLG